MDNIGRYQVVRELGRGAMGVVYLAQHPTMNRLVAIKTFRTPDGDENDWDTRARLLAEADRAGSLDHPNIVKIYNVEDRTEPPYIEMEFVDGLTLDQLLTTSPPETDLTISVLRQAAEALDYAHNHGIIHRDIKPANLMMDSKNAVKITDFGIAKRAGTNTSTTSRFMGTPDYMSPEQLDGRPDIDGRADQFALATIAYQLVAGRKPFEADTVTAVSHMIANKDPIPPSQLNRKLPRQVDAVIGKALSKSREKRYPTCTEFTDALELALLAPPRRAIPVWAPIAAAVVLLIALIVVGSKFCWFGGCEPPLVVSVTPPSAVLSPSQTQQFTASGGTVRWSLSPEVGSVSEDGLYKAPAAAPAEQTVTLTATAADGDAHAIAEIKLLPSVARALSVTPSTAVLMSGDTQQFTASAANVRWSIAPNVGSISPAGLYYAPANLRARQPVTVTATDGSSSAAASIELLPGKTNPLPALPIPPRIDTTTASLNIYVKDTLVKSGARTAPPEGSEYWVGDIQCHVVANGLPRNAKLRLVWYKDNEEAGINDFGPPDSRGIRVRYENKAEPGKYRVRLLIDGKPVNPEVTFTVLPAKSQGNG
jgi:serine/threonine protein kinase